jgi:hypothetical protein
MNRRVRSLVVFTYNNANKLDDRFGALARHHSHINAQVLEDPTFAPGSVQDIVEK